MDRDSMKKLRLDRRLIGRRGWISSDELKRELQALPDASSKATTLGEATEGDRGGAAGSGSGQPGSSSGA